MFNEIIFNLKLIIKKDLARKKIWFLLKYVVPNQDYLEKGTI